MPHDVSHIALDRCSGLDSSGNVVETHLEGGTKVFENFVVPTAYGFWTKYNNRQAEFILARNVSGSTLAPGRLVQWAAGYRGRRFDSYSVTHGMKPAGVISPLIPSSRGVLNNELCWLQRTGVCPVKTPTVAASFGGNFVEGDPVYCLGGSGAAGTTSGRVTRFGNNKLFQSIVAATVLTNTVTATDFDQSLSIPANCLQVGDVINIHACVTCPSTNSTDTLTLLLKFGGITLATTGAIDVANNDVGVFDAQVVVRALGAAGAGSFAAMGLQTLGVPGTATVKAFNKLDASAFDTTAAVTCLVNGQWSVASASNQARLDLLTVEINRVADCNYIGRAYQALANTNTDADFLVDLDLTP